MSRAILAPQRIQYTGNNGSAIATALGGLQVLSDTGTVLTLPQDLVIPLNNWLLYNMVGSTVVAHAIVTNAYYEAVYIAPAVEKVLVTRKGTAALPAAPLGLVDDEYEVVLDAPMSTTDFEPDFLIWGGNGHHVESWSIDDEETLTVRVISGVLAAAATLRVTARELVVPE